MSPRASAVYEIQREPVAFWRRLPCVIVVFVTNVLSMGSGPVNPGGGTVRIIETETGRVANTLVEELGDDGQGTVSSITADLTVMPADEFEEVAIAAGDPPCPRSQAQGIPISG